MISIRVQKIGEDLGFCSEYYKSKKGCVYVKVIDPLTQEEAWYTTNNKDREPECRIDPTQCSMIEVKQKPTKETNE